MIERANVEQLKSKELLRLAQVLKLSIQERKIVRQDLINKIMIEIDGRNKNKKQDMELTTPAIKIESLIKRKGVRRPFIIEAENKIVVFPIAYCRSRQDYRVSFKMVEEDLNSILSLLADVED